MDGHKLSVIIPVINEERTIAGLVQTIISWGKANEIIVIDDEASADDSWGAVKQFKNAVRYIRNPKNRGRGDAIACGIENATGDMIMMIEGDVTNVTHRDLTRLLLPMTLGKADMVIGVPKYWSATIQGKKLEPWNDVCGTRIFLRKNVLSKLPAIHKAGYGVEVLLNSMHKKQKILTIRWTHVYVFNKFDKQTVPDAVKAYIREAKELIVEVTRQQGKSITPQVNRIFRGIQRYLQQALEYFQ